MRRAVAVMLALMLGVMVGCAQTESQKFASTLAVHDGILDGVAFVAEQDGFTPAEARENLEAIAIADAGFELWKQSIERDAPFDIAGILEEMARLARNESEGRERLKRESESAVGDRDGGEPAPADPAGDAGGP